MSLHKHRTSQSSMGVLLLLRWKWQSGHMLDHTAGLQQLFCWLINRSSITRVDILAIKSGVAILPFWTPFLLILAQKKGQGRYYMASHMLKRIRTVKAWSWKKEGSCQSRSMPIVLLEQIFSWGKSVLFHWSLNEDLSLHLEQMYSLDQCYCAVVSGKCQLLQYLLQRRGKSSGIMLWSHRSNFGFSLKFSKVTLAKMFSY